MVKIVCNFKDMSMDIVDDSECTPGASRQLTEFKNFIFLEMKRRWAKVSRENAQDGLLGIANIPILNGFKLVSSKSRNGCAELVYEREA